MELQNTTKSAEHHGKLHQMLWELSQTENPSKVLPDPKAMEHGRESLPTELASHGIGFEATKEHILNDIVPGLNNSSMSPNYYGFVTGGVTPAALFADNIVSVYDQNVQVHLPEHSLATFVESTTLHLLVQLLRLDPSWKNGIFTTGATGSNILGLACGREYVLRGALIKCGVTDITSAGESGLFETMQAAGLTGIQVLSTMPHSSLVKAAGILGVGRTNVKDVSLTGDPLRFDLQKLETELQKSSKASIVAVSCGEVNTGRFATSCLADMQALRRLCDKYGAWLHVDGAFGLFGRILEPSPEFEAIQEGSEGVELADSITGDGHKMLNVPYDCGFFLCRHPDEAARVFKNANAAYLTGGNQMQAVPSPLDIGLENSRRFRALPVYASLVAYGRTGYQTMVQKQIRLARKIGAWLFDHPKYDVLPASKNKEELLDRTFMVVLFKAKDGDLNRDLAAKINKTSKMFVSGTSFQGQSASRIAISNWKVDVERDFALVQEVLDSVVGV